MNFYLKTVSFLVIIMFLLFPLFSVNAQTPPVGTDYCKAPNKNISGCIMQNTAEVGLGTFGTPTTNLPQFIGNIIKFSLTLMGSIFMLLIIYGGFMWMTAGGNPEQAKKAAQILRNSVIGLIIIIVSYAVTITVFDIIWQATAPPPVFPGPP